MNHIPIKQAINHYYDFIVIGSGFGGSACSYMLSNANFKVLLIEQGKPIERNDLCWDSEHVYHKQSYKQKTPHIYENKRGFKKIFLNQALGGNSIFFGAAAIRFRENDFEKWPICYNDLLPYYEQAERLLEIDTVFSRNEFVDLPNESKLIGLAGEKMGLKPHRIPLVINNKNSNRAKCIQCQTCDGYPCKIGAKNDVTMTLLAKSNSFQLNILCNTKVVKLVLVKDKIQSVCCLDLQSGSTFYIKSKKVIISAGAINSAALLLRSDVASYDQSNLLGRRLMQHCCSIVVGGPLSRPNEQFHKYLYFDDHYESVRMQFGTSLGIVQEWMLPHSSVIANQLTNNSFLYPLFRWFGDKVWKYMQGLIVFAEDDPQLSNRVTLDRTIDKNGIPLTKIVYNNSRNDKQRNQQLSRVACKILRNRGAKFVFSKHFTQTFSHAVGTTTFGECPKTSVLDKNCKFHHINNLYVIDGSFMPTSAGVNPSLTITANALRVAEHIIRTTELI